MEGDESERRLPRGLFEVYILFGRHRRKVAVSIIFWFAATALLYMLRLIGFLTDIASFSAIYAIAIVCLCYQFYWVKAEVPQNYWPLRLQYEFASNHKLRRSAFILTAIIFVVAIFGPIQIYENPSNLEVFVLSILTLLIELAIFPDTVALFGTKQGWST